MSGRDGAFPGLPWADRPAEEAALFNPAFCGELVARAVSAYASLRGAALPFALAYLVLPLSLPSAFRSALPRRMDVAFASWAGDNADLLAGLPDRVARLRPVTREALLFMMQVRALAAFQGGVGPGTSPLPLSRDPAAATEETRAIRRAAGLLGRWFSVQGSAAAILQTMGVTV